MEKKINIKELEEKIGYSFRDKSLILQALTRTSFCNENKLHGKVVYQSNEVLEFFGDSVLSTAIVASFVKEYAVRYEHGIKTKFAEGDFTVIKSRLSDKKNLSNRARELGLGKYLRMGEGDAKLGIADEASVLEDVFESIIGAIYIDSDMNMQKVVSVVSGMLDIKSVISSKSNSTDATVRSAKNRLQEWCADKKRRLPPPTYETVGESGPEHKKIYTRVCKIGDKAYAKGEGKNLKEADADAAEKTLAILKNGEPRVTKTQEKTDAEALVKLREYAKSRKLSTPTFKDMGETEASTAKVREYAVKCSFSQYEATATASDKSSARAFAAGKILDLIKRENSAQKANKTAPRVTKNKAKSSKNVHRKG